MNPKEKKYVTVDVKFDRSVKIPLNLKELREYENEIINALTDLEITMSFKEIEGFKHLTFRTFLEEVFHVSEYSYNNLKWAWQWHPERCMKYGSTVVIKVKKRYGVAKIDKVFERIDEKIERLKTADSKRRAIHEIIDESKKK